MWRGVSFARTSSVVQAWKIHTHLIWELLVRESYIWSCHMQSLTFFGRVDSDYTWVRHLDNSRLRETLIFEKSHDWKYEIFRTWITLGVLDIQQNETQHCVSLYWIFLRWVSWSLKCYAESHYDECHNVEFHNAECHYVDWHFAESHNNSNVILNVIVLSVVMLSVVIS